MEELYTLSGDRWSIIISQVEPGTVEHKQGAKMAITIYYDGEPFVSFASVESRKGEAALAQDHPTVNEGPDLVSFVLSYRDIDKLQFLLARAHYLIRGGTVPPDLVKSTPLSRTDV